LVGGAERFQKRCFEAETSRRVKVGGRGVLAHPRPSVKKSMEIAEKKRVEQKDYMKIRGGGNLLNPPASAIVGRERQTYRCKKKRDFYRAKRGKREKEKGTEPDAWR